MKKTRIIAAATIVLLASCQKEPSIVNNSSTPEISLDQFKFEQKTVFNKLNNSDDKADHHINVCLFKAGEAIKNTLLTSRNEITTLFNKYESGENVIKVSELVTEQSVNFTDQNHYNTFSEMEKSMVYHNVNYYPVLSLMNTSNAKTVLANSEKLIIAIAVEINDEDAVPGWIIENGIATETTVLEKDLNGSTPIFIVQNSTYASNNDLTNFKWIGERDNNTPETTGPITIDWDRYRIKNGHRYENTGRSELQYVVTFYKPTSPYLDGSWFLTLTNTYGLLSHQINRKIKGIKKSQISSSTFINDNEWFIQSHPSDLYDVADAQYYITVYERDWAQSHKAVQSCETITHNVEMKYSNEWYYVDYCGFSAKDSFVGANFEVDNSKCTLKLTRTI